MAAGSLMLLGAVVGPLQPLASELAVGVTFPLDANAVEATQQLTGNLFSAVLMPICLRESRKELALPEDLDIMEHFTHRQSDMFGDSAVLIVAVAVALASFVRFDAPLLREQADMDYRKNAKELETTS